MIFWRVLNYPHIVINPTRIFSKSIRIYYSSINLSDYYYG